MPSNETASTPSPAEIEAISYLTGAVRGYERAGGSSPVIVVPVGYVRTLLAALAAQEAARRDGDDSARLEGLDAELRKQGASWRSSFRAWGHDFTLFEDGWHVAVDAISDPIIDGADLRSAIDAARTAPGGASNAK